MRASFPIVILCLSVGIAFGQWEPDQRLTNDPANSFLANPNNHPLCVSGDSVYAIFSDDRTGAFQVYLTRSWDAGTTWDSAVCLSNDLGHIFYPALAVSGEAVHLAWTTYASTVIKYRRSTDAGSTWSAEETLVAAPRGRGDASLAAEGNTVGIAWGDKRDDDNNVEVYLKRSSDGGQTWGPDTRLTVSPNTSDKEPWLAIAGNTWHLAWARMSWTGHHPRAWYQRSTDGGASWLTPAPLTLDTTSSNQPGVAAVGPNVHVCWWDGRPGGYGTWYRGSTDNGATWNTEQYLADTTYGSDYPAIAAAGGNVHLVYRAWPAGHFVIDYRVSTDNGQSWSAETALTTAAGMGTADLAATGSRAHLLLYDDRDGNFEVYHKRNLTAGGVEEHHTLDGSRITPAATIVHGALLLPSSSFDISHSSLLDALGRKVMDIAPGENDVSRLCPGVYFVRPATGARPPATKVVITR